MSNNDSNFKPFMPWRPRASRSSSNENVSGRLHSISLNNRGVTLLKQGLYESAKDHLYGALRGCHCAILANCGAASVGDCEIPWMASFIQTNDMLLDDVMVTPTASPSSGT